MCHVGIAVGAGSGGWPLVSTMGMRPAARQPVGGFCAETAGAIALLGSATFGIPGSTTHTITGAIVGVGSTRRFSAGRRGGAPNGVLAGILAPPRPAAVRALLYMPLPARGAPLSPAPRPRHAGGGPQRAPLLDAVAGAGPAAPRDDPPDPPYLGRVAARRAARVRGQVLQVQPDDAFLQPRAARLSAAPDLHRGPEPLHVQARRRAFRRLPHPSLPFGQVHQ